MVKTTYACITAYPTKDASIIRELMHPAIHGGSRISLAEAIVPGKTTTNLHQHLQAEEIYHITGGSGEMILGHERFTVHPGDTILIPPGTPHQLLNPNTTELKLLCCCSPPYSHADTLLLPGTTD